eukprot:1192827-Prorocentrum_minimum.AAC.4
MLMISAGSTSKEGVWRGSGGGQISPTTALSTAGTPIPDLAEMLMISAGSTSNARSICSATRLGSAVGMSILLITGMMVRPCSTRRIDRTVPTQSVEFGRTIARPCSTRRIDRTVPT